MATSTERDGACWSSVLRAALAGGTVGVILLALAVVLTPYLSFLSGPADEPTGRRVALAEVLCLAVAGILVGANVRRYGVRYLRTRFSMPRLVTSVDQMLVGLLSGLAALAFFARLLGLQADIKWLQFIGLEQVTLALALPFLVALIVDNVAVRFENSDHRSKARPAHANMYSDDAVRSEAEDLLHRGVALDALAAIAQEGGDRTTSLVVALDGKWGEGKTSVLRMLEGRLRTDENLLFIWFDPWNYANPEALLKAFFHTLNVSVSKHYLIPDLRSSVGKYLKALSPGLGKLGVSLEPFGEMEIEALRSQIAHVVLGLKPHLIVVLDDLDRLDKPELQVVLKLIKLSADFPNVTYLLAMDRSKVSTNIDPAEGSSFLEKFVDVDLALPVIDQADLDTFFLSEVSNILKRSTVVRLTGVNNLADTYRKVGRRSVQTLRDAKRTLNAFSNALAALPGDVNIGDLLLLEIVRRLSMETWVAVAEHPEFFVRELRDPWVWWSDDDWEKGRKKFYEDVIGRVPVALQARCRDILREVFPIMRLDKATGEYYDSSARREQRACDPSYFFRYFMYRLRPGLVSDQDIHAFLDRVNGAQPQQVQEILSQAVKRWRGKLNQVYDRLVALADEIDSSKHSALIEAAAVLSKDYDDTPPGQGAPPEAERARAFIFVLASKHQNTPQIQTLLESAMHRSGSLGFAASVLHFSQRRVNRIISQWDNISLERLQAAFDALASSKLLGTGNDILDDEQVWWRSIVRLWSDKTAKTAYVRQLAKLKPGRLGDVIASYVSVHPLFDDGTREEGRVFDFQRLQEDWDVSGLSDLLAEVGPTAWSSVTVQWAVEQFQEALLRKQAD